jgi:hypothetical protein
LERPAVFVFVSPSARTTAALPSQGGFRSQGRNRWIENRAAWPYKPSLDDVDWVNGRARRNAPVPLVFKIVDTDGLPMGGVDLGFEIRRFRTLQEMRSDGYDTHSRTTSEPIRVTTANDGIARATVNGFHFRSFNTVQLRGTRWDAGPFPIVGLHDNYYVRDFLDQSGNLIFRCDDENPITLVMAGRDEKVTHVLPSRGGYEKRGDEDVWKRIEPSVPDGIGRPMKYLPRGAATSPAEPATTRPDQEPRA